MAIEEFLDIYAPAEVDKMIETDPKREFEKNQAVNKAIDNNARVVKQIKS
jgi:hypothetical protein